jgi:hypothetical protein
LTKEIPGGKDRPENFKYPASTAGRITAGKLSCIIPGGIIPESAGLEINPPGDLSD